MPRKFKFSATRIAHGVQQRGAAGSASGGGGVGVIGSTPTVTSILPSSGTIAGGTAITITGTNFISGATVVIGVSCTSVSVVNSTTITCTTANTTAGAKAVVVTTSVGVGSLTAGYTYVGAPTIAVGGISPSSGSVDGSTFVSITGTNFIAGASVTFSGDAATSVTVVSLESLTCRPPAHAAGAGDVVVTTASGAATATNGYTFVTTDEPADPSSYIWSDDFERYWQGTSNATILSMGNDASDATWGTRTLPNSPNGNTPQYEYYSIIAGRTGGYAIRVTYPDSSGQQNHNILTPFRHSGSYYLSAHALYTTQATLVCQYWFRITNNWSPGTGSGGGIKWFEMWSANIPGGGDIAAGGSDRTQYTYYLGAVDTGPLLMMEPSMSGGVNNRGVQHAAPYYENINDGEWHRFTALYKPNTTKATWVSAANATALSIASSRDGRNAVWIDGTKVMDIQQSLVAGGVWCTQNDVDAISNLDIDWLKLPDNLNGTNRGNGSIDIDDIKVWIL